MAAHAPNPDLPRFRAEARLERRLPVVQALCQALQRLDVRGAATAWADLDPAQQRTLEVLGTALARLRTLAQQYEKVLGLEEKGHWESALESYEGIANGLPQLGLAAYRDVATRSARVRGQVAVEQTLKRGRTAFEIGQWAQAFEAFSALPANHSEREPNRSLAGAFAAIDRGNWKEAVSFLEPVCKAHPQADVGSYLSYARARVAEDDQDWPRAAELYKPLARARFEDARERAAYCAGREAAAAGRWQEAVDLLDRAGAVYGDARNLGHYCRGRLAEDQRQWSEAAECYRQVPGNIQADRDARLQRRDIWTRVGERLQARDWEGAAAELDRLAALQLNDSASVKRWWRWCRNLARPLAEALEVLKAGRWVLAADGVVTNAGPNLVEFLTFTVADPARAAEALDQYSRFVELPEPPTPEQVAEHLGDDRGLFFILIRMPQTALDLFRAAARERPDDVNRLHRLGLAALSKINLARLMQEIPERADWELLIASWGAVLAGESRGHQEAEANGQARAAGGVLAGAVCRPGRGPRPPRRSVSGGAGRGPGRAGGGRHSARTQRRGVVRCRRPAGN